MKKSSRWATIISVVCGAEVVLAVIIGGAGLAAILRPKTILVVGCLLAILAGSRFLKQRRAGNAIDAPAKPASVN